MQQSTETTPAEEYENLARHLRNGHRETPTTIRKTLKKAGKTHENLVYDVFAGPGVGPQSGDPCPKCKTGRLRVYASRRSTRVVKQYLGCGSCKHKPTNNTRVVPACAVPRRRRINVLRT